MIVGVFTSYELGLSAATFSVAGDQEHQDHTKKPKGRRRLAYKTLAAAFGRAPVNHSESQKTFPVEASNVERQSQVCLR